MMEKNISIQIQELALDAVHELAKAHTCATGNFDCATGRWFRSAAASATWRNLANNEPSTSSLVG